MFSDINVVQTDVLFISGKRTSIIQEAYIAGAPDLAVEVLSPSNKDRDLKAKRALYSRFGVREYWIVDPRARTIEQLVYKDRGLVTVAVVPENGTLAATVLPGFRLDLDGIFEFDPSGGG